MKLSDQTAAKAADDDAAELEAMFAAESAREAAELSENSENELDEQLAEEAEEVETRENPPTTPEGEDQLPETEQEHDILATLNEEETTPPKEEVVADNSPRYAKDAKNLANKWDDLSEGEKLDKVKTLAKNRPQTFQALATELGTNPDILLDQFELDSTDLPESIAPPEVDYKQIAKDAEEAAYKRFQAENAKNTDKSESERNRFVTEVSNFAKHNKLDAETTTAITDMNGELFKKFESLKFDPKTGEALSMKGRLKIALNGDKAINDALIKSGILKHSKRVLAGVNSSLPPSGRAITKSDGSDIAASSDEDFAKKMKSYSNSGIADLQL